MLQAATAITSYDVIVIENQVRIISVLLLFTIFVETFGKRLQVLCTRLQNYTIGTSILCIRIWILKSNITLTTSLDWFIIMFLNQDAKEHV